MTSTNVSTREHSASQTYIKTALTRKNSYKNSLVLIKCKTKKAKFNKK